MLTEERLIVREGARYWLVFLASGVLWLLIAWLVLRLNATSITTVGVLLGVVFLIAGINEVGMASLAPGGWKVWHYVMAGIFLLGGLWGFVRPVNTFFALASVLGLVLVFYGAFEVVLGVASQAVNPYWWLQLITGLLLILLAFWVGFLALFRGFSQIMLAFSVRHAREEAAALDPAGPGVGAGQPSTGGAS